jgi:hypothetical protein
VPESSFNHLPLQSPQSPLFSSKTNLVPIPKPAMFRRFNCHTSPPVKLNDYVCSNVCSTQSSSLLPSPTKYTYYPLANYVSYHRYKPAYLFFFCSS